MGNGRKNIKLDQALFIDIGPLNRDPGLSVWLKMLESALNVALLDFLKILTWTMYIKWSWNIKTILVNYGEEMSKHLEILECLNTFTMLRSTPVMLGGTELTFNVQKMWEICEKFPTSLKRVLYGHLCVHVGSECYYQLESRNAQDNRIPGWQGSRWHLVIKTRVTGWGDNSPLRYLIFMHLADSLGKDIYSKLGEWLYKEIF